MLLLKMTRSRWRRWQTASSFERWNSVWEPNSKYWNTLFELRRSKVEKMVKQIAVTGATLDTPPSLCFSPPPQPEMLHQVGSLFLTEKILDLFCSDSSFLSCKYTYIIIFSLRHYHQHLYLVLNHIDSRYNILISIGDDFSGDGWFGRFKADRQCLSGPEGGKMSRVLGSTDWGIWIILAN